MNYCERIPVKTQALKLSGTNVRVDCEGLEVSVLANGADVFLKAHESVSDENAYVIKSGESVTLCGSFVLNSSSADVRMLFCKVI